MTVVLQRLSGVRGGEEAHRLRRGCMSTVGLGRSVRALWLACVSVPQAVEELLRVMGASASESVPVPSWHYEEEGVAPGGSMPLAQALTKCYDIRWVVHAPDSCFRLTAHPIKG